MKSYQMQGLLAGNFLNMGLLAILIVQDDMYGVAAVVASWAFAYVSAVAEDFRVTWFNAEYTGGWFTFLMVGYVGCVGCSVFAMLRAFNII